MREEVLGPNIFDGERQSVVIDRHEWQQALSRGKWTLVGCTGESDNLPPFLPRES